MSEFSINNPNGYLAGPLGSFRVYGADGRLKAIGAGGGGGATWGTITGNILNQTDLIDYITNHAGGVPTSRTLSINGVTYDLSADRSWTIPAGGTVTDVTGTGMVSGLTLSGSGTTSVTLTLGGSLSLSSGQVTSALGYTPYDATNPAGYITSSALTNYVTNASLSSTLTGYVTNNIFTNTISGLSSVYQQIFTTQNGLTYGGGYLKLGGQLSENTTIDGKQGTYSLSFLELSQLTLQASDLTNTTEINLTTTQMQVKTPLYGSKTAGDVLTLKDPATGEVEFETPTGGSQSLQDVTNVGSTTTNGMSVDTGTGDYSYIAVNSVGAYNSTTAGYTELSSSGTVSLTPNSVGVGILAANNVAAGNVQLEFPNKPAGTYTIATTADIPTGGGIPFAVASGTDTYTATITGVTAYANGDAYLIRFTNGNTDSATLNINSLGPIPLHQTNQIPLIGGDIWDGGEMLCIYNATDTSFECIGTSPNSLFVYVTNVNGSTITKGQAVYAFGGTGNRMTVKLAQANADSTSAQTIGFVYSTSIADGQKGIIIVQGYFSGLSLFQLSAGWADGSPVYLSPTTPGAVTFTKPYAPNHLVYLGVVATANNGNAGRMYVRVQNGYELDEIHDVAITNPLNRQTLFYNSTTTLWENRGIEAADIPSVTSNATFGVTVDGGGGVITNGVKGYVKVPYACTITGWTVMSTVSGSITFDIWKSSAGLPTVGNTIISGGTKPYLSNQTLRNSSSLTGWATSVAANDYLAFNVDSASSVTWAVLQIFITK